MDTAVPLIVVAALAAAALAGPARVRAPAMLLLVLLLPTLLLAHIWDTDQVESLRGRPALAAGAAAAGLTVVALLAALFDRRPGLLPLAVVVTVPFRVPIELGGSTANLLIPLYLVIGAGALAHALGGIRRRHEETAGPGSVGYLLAVTLLLYALQASYSSDFDRALENVVFFYAPFALLFALLARVDWTPRLMTQCLLLLVVLAAAFVGVGFYEYATRHLLLNPKVIAANQFQSYFRVNSLFFDPNIYGRFLAIVMIALAGVLIWARRARDVAAGAALLALLWAGLVLTFSQSSFAALLAGLAVLGGLRWNAAWAARAALAAAAIGIVLVLAVPSALHLNLSSSKSLHSATGGRSELVEGAVDLFRAKPIAGHGSGSFATEYRASQEASARKAVSASHTIPLTVAAEQGAIGLALYVALVIAALRTMLRGAYGRPWRAALAAAFVALLVHTMSYAAFLEDPLSWLILAVGMAVARADSSEIAASREEPEPVPAGG